jgi:hypothetical protein
MLFPVFEISSTIIPYFLSLSLCGSRGLKTH